jgi:hypothetical protein
MSHAPTHIAGDVLIIASLAYFCAVETRWFSASRNVGHLRAFASVAVALLQGALFMILVGFLFTR